ncbi:MAG: MerR family DNA-binding transcriptional regulator [Mangrovicoccus sp.]|nr:MerR family DNA-binding transcriptional regulator [Mangrovicoccus sp.]
MNTKTMTIREMCDAFQVTARTLRFYETKELLAPIRVGQKRLFTNRDRARLKLILRGKRYGFSLEEIRQILELYSPEDNLKQIQLTVNTAKQHLAGMMDERDRLDRIISELKEELTGLEKALARTSPDPILA